MATAFHKHTGLVAAALLIAGLATTQFALGRKKDKAAGAMDEHTRAVHALNRLTFGPHPGDVDRVAQIGVDKWIELQLHPEKIDDSDLDARLVPFRTLRMDTREIVENFPNNQIIRQVAEGKAPMPRDPTRRAIYEAQVQRYEDRQDRKSAAEQKSSIAGNSSAGQDAESGADISTQADASYGRRRQEMQAANIKLLELLDLPPDERIREILKLPPEEQRMHRRPRPEGPSPTRSWEA